VCICRAHIINYLFLAYLLIPGPPNGPVLFCLLASIVCGRRLSASSVPLPAGGRAGRVGGRVAYTARRASTVTSRQLYLLSSLSVLGRLVVCLSFCTHCIVLSSCNELNCVQRSFYTACISHTLPRHAMLARC